MQSTPRLLFLALLGPVAPVTAQSASFAELHQMLPQSPSPAAREVELVDWDGDGDLDVFQVRVASADLVYANDGTGRFELAANQPPGTGDSVSHSSIAFGDLDGDGDLDGYLAVDPPCCEAQFDVVYRNDGGGTFFTLLGPPTGVTQDVALGDVDGDGDLDAFCANRSIFMSAFGYNVVRLNDGTAQFPTFGTQPLEEDESYAVELFDADGDGDLDAWIGNLGLDRLLLGDGAGTFVDAGGQIPVDADGTRSLGVADVDGDGDLDVLRGNDGQDVLYLNDGAGGFGGAVGALPVDAVPTLAVELVDVDTDGDLDVLFARRSFTSPQAAPNALALNDGSGLFTPSAGLPAEADPSIDLVAGDLDGDGDVDAVVANGLNTTVSPGASPDRLFLGDGAGSFTEVTSAFGYATDATEVVALADFDGDGFLDLLTGNGRGVPGGEQPALVHANDGTGLFPASVAVTGAALATPTSVAVGDVDGDGDPDALVGNAYNFSPGPNEAQNQLFRNDGGALVDATGQLPAVLDETGDVELVDVDGDGDLDALIGNRGTPMDGGTSVLLVNDGAGTFATAPGALPDTSYVGGLATGDVDDDGDADVLVGVFGNGFGVTSQLFLNDGAGTFTDASGQLPADPGTSARVALGDLDGDGDLDAFCGHPTRVWWNDGGGTFTEAALAGSSFGPILLGDVEDDGDLDVLSAETLFRNDGAGGLVAEPFPYDGPTADALGDVDGDGDLDLVRGAERERVLVNLRRQVAWRSFPRVGQPLTVDVYGAPGASWLLGCATGTGSFPLAVGVLRLDPSGLRLIDGGVLDAEGRAASLHPIPDDASLVDQAFWWQALVDAPLGFSNLERTTLSGL